MNATNKSNPPAHDRGWHLVDHACKFCLGRLLTRTNTQGRFETICAECESQVDNTHEALCCCGAEYGSGRKILECYKNATKAKDLPQAVLVRERQT